MSSNKRIISYCNAINEAIASEMMRDKKVFVYGVEDKMFGSLDNLKNKFGSNRFFSTPISEEALTGFGFGAAISGLKPIYNHIRVDFMILGMNQLINMISSYCYGNNGKVGVPIVIRAVIGRGWGQGYQHSKSLQSIFAHIPGLKVIMPTTPYDAKGMMINAIRDKNPVISLEHRWLYWQEDHVPRKSYVVPFGKASTLKKGKDISIICSSWMNVEASLAADFLKTFGIDLEIIDIRSVSPLDKSSILKSVEKTKRCIIADYDWTFCGISAEISDIILKLYKKLKCKIERIGFEESPCPTTRVLENKFYPSAITIINKVVKMLGVNNINTKGLDLYSHEKRFKGPF